MTEDKWLLIGWLSIGVGTVWFVYLVVDWAIAMFERTRNRG